MTGMGPANLILGALACLLLALALWVFTRGRRKEHEESINRHMQRSVDGSREAAAPALSLAEPAFRTSVPQSTPAPAAVQWLSERVGLQSWGISPRTLLVFAAVGAVLALLAASQAGTAAALTTAVLYGVVLAFGIWRRQSKRRERLLQQLPGFLDNMVRLISIGNSPHAAFQMALGNVQAPLGDALQQAAAMLSASPDLGQAMGHLERNWRLPEFGLLAAVFRMSVRYGGRADLVLERVSAYIRDRQSAERELHALSSEIRMSAWVLALLPLVVGGLIMVINRGYFMRMWNDDSGQTMVLVAAALEVCGAFFLYRLARLR
jgi:tight adherence protein B